MIDHILKRNVDKLVRWIRQRKGPFAPDFIDIWYERYLTAQRVIDLGSCIGDRRADPVREPPYSNPIMRQWELQCSIDGVIPFYWGKNLRKELLTWIVSNGTCSL